MGGYGEQVTNEVEMTQEPANTGPPVFSPAPPPARPAEKCFPQKKKFCKCRSSSSTPGPSFGSSFENQESPRPTTPRPTGGPGTSPSGGSPTGPGPVPTGEMGLIPHLLSSVASPITAGPSSLAPGEGSTSPSGPTGEIPYLLGSRPSGSPTMHMGSVPYLLSR